MRDIIFKHFLEKKAKTKKWVTLPVSFLLHGVVTSALIIAPLITAETNMPSLKDDVIVAYIAPPSRLPLPRGSGGSHGKKLFNKDNKEPKEKKPKKKMPRIDGLFMPQEIPQDIAIEKIPDPGMPGIGPYVPGAPVRSGVIGAPSHLFNMDDTTTEILPVMSVKQPILIKKIKPIYPKAAQIARIQGDVVIEAVTDVYGRVIRTRILSGRPLLNEAAIAAVKRWIYEPYIICGLPKPVKFTVIINFRLKN